MALGHVPIRGGRGGDRAAWPRSVGVSRGRGPALLSDEPRPHRGGGNRHGGQRLHRAHHPRAAHGVRRRAEPSDRAPDGRRDRLAPTRSVSMGETLAEVDLYTATIPRSRKSPRQYSVVRVRGNQLVLRYGWFAFADGVSPSPQDRWTWSPQGVFRLSQFEF